MGYRLPHELLEELRTYLQHFDLTEHLGERSTVDEIRRRLKARIAEVEAEIGRNSQSPRPPMGDALSQSATTSQLPASPPKPLNSALSSIYVD